MVPLMSLWLPIVLSAVFVFVASSIIHMMLTYHKNDFRKAANEEDLQETLRVDALPEGSYHTAAGLVLALLGRLPARGDAVEWGGWRLEVAAMDGRSIARLVARRTVPSDADSSRP